MRCRRDLVSARNDPISSADDQRSELDKALTDVVERANQVLATQGRLRALLRANQAVVEQLDLPIVLQRIVEAALQLVNAEYGALGVIDPARGDLEQFIYEGISPEVAEKIGHLPEGHGLLGALIDDPRPIRLEHLSEDDRSAGFPRHHPSMDSFVGVPIRIHDEVFGNLYLTNRKDSGSFSREDEQLLAALAATAGFAIENARLFAETQRRQKWSAVTAEITAALLSADQTDSIAVVAERVLEVAAASHVRVVVPTEEPGRLLIREASARRSKARSSPRRAPSLRAFSKAETPG
jgi:GAF domain-containing protein